MLGIDYCRCRAKKAFFEHTSVFGDPVILRTRRWVQDSREGIIPSTFSMRTWSGPEYIENTPQHIFRVSRYIFCKHVG
jgi:hypothetical protein